MFPVPLSARKTPGPPLIGPCTLCNEVGAALFCGNGPSEARCARSLSGADGMSLSRSKMSAMGSFSCGLSPWNCNKSVSENKTQNRPVQVQNLCWLYLQDSMKVNYLLPALLPVLPHSATDHLKRNNGSKSLQKWQVFTFRWTEGKITNISIVSSEEQWCMLGRETAENPPDCLCTYRWTSVLCDAGSKHNKRR